MARLSSHHALANSLRRRLSPPGNPADFTQSDLGAQVLVDPAQLGSEPRPWKRCMVFRVLERERRLEVQSDAGSVHTVPFNAVCRVYTGRLAEPLQVDPAQLGLSSSLTCVHFFDFKPGGGICRAQVDLPGQTGWLFVATPRALSQRVRNTLGFGSRALLVVPRLDVTLVLRAGGGRSLGRAAASSLLPDRRLCSAVG